LTSTSGTSVAASRSAASVIFGAVRIRPSTELTMSRSIAASTFADASVSTRNWRYPRVRACVWEPRMSPK
jgi:hypothetical protein